MRGSASDVRRCRSSIKGWVDKVSFRCLQVETTLLQPMGKERMLSWLIYCLNL